MNIREKIQAKDAEIKEDNILNKTIRRAFITIVCGYLGGTIIGLILRRLIYG